MRTTSAKFLLTASAVATFPIFPAFAQTGADVPHRAPPASIEQISDSAGRILAPPPVPRTVAPPAQLTSERQSRPLAAQIYKGKRTAQSSTPLSRPADGRTGAVDRVEGKDRCDPVAQERRQAPACENVIESRAAEFGKADSTPLSPEQRIIVAQQLRERGNTAGAARLLAIGLLDADSADGQEVASIVLKPPPEPVKKKEPVEEPTAEEQAVAIVNAIISQPQR